jgi:CheY-like chemotaxis protein
MKQKILLVDDRPENIFVLESTLENPALEFIKADCGEEALKQLLRNDISIILLDVQMPGMDGFETAELIRGNPVTKNIPIIFVSAINQEKKHIFKGYASGAIDYIFKPFDPEILKSKVNVLLDLDKQRRIVERQNNELSNAKRNTDSIFQNVKEGLFLLNKENKILPQYSQALEGIFETQNLANTDLLSVLKKSVPDKAFEEFCEFLSLSFDSSIASSSISELNPLSEVEFKQRSSPGEIKYLSFDCRRIYNGDDIEKLIFTVNDNTSRVLLEKKLTRIEKESNKQMDNLFSIIHVDPMLLRDFIESLKRDMQDAKSSIEKLSKDKDITDILESLYRSIHQIKGNAAVLDLKNFMNQAHKAEDIISSMLKNGKASKSNIEQFEKCLQAFETRVDEINIIISKLNHIYKYFRPKRSFEADLLFNAMNNLVENLQKKTGKKVKLDSKNFDSTDLPYNYQHNIKDIIVQLMRNAFYHGIESTEERKKLKKNTTGIITIETIKDDKTVGFSFRDDGRGIQLSKLKSAAMESGKWQQDEINQWNDQQLTEIIYCSGITTMAKANSGAGRGVGMDIIKNMVDQSGGSIEIESEPDRYTLFKITFPLESMKDNPVIPEVHFN